MDIREATPDDAAAISRVRIDTWRVAYDGLVAPEVLASLDHATETERRRASLRSHRPQDGLANLVAERDGEVVGWAAVGPGLGEPDMGELYALYVLPSQWSTGAGHALLVAAEQVLVDAGIGRAVLWHLEGNDRAARFYGRHGWALDGEEKVDDRAVGGVQAWALHEVRRSKTIAQTDRAKATASSR